MVVVSIRDAGHVRMAFQRGVISRKFVASVHYLLAVVSGQ